MEPAFLDRLPPRFRERFRENIVTLGVLAALVVVPPRCGPYGYAAFFTIVWLAFSAFVFRQFAKVAASARAYILPVVMTLLFGYPIAVGWLYRTIDGYGALAFLGGMIVYLVIAVACRRVIFPSIFGADRRSIWSEARMVRSATRETRAEQTRSIEALKDQFRK